MKKLLTILFCASLFLFAACEDPGEDLLQKKDEVKIDNSQRIGPDFMQGSD